MEKEFWMYELVFYDNLEKIDRSYNYGTDCICIFYMPNNVTYQKFEDLFKFSYKIFYDEILTVLAVVGILISFLAYYLISTVKIPNIGAYKYYLINVTTWNALLLIDTAILVRKHSPAVIKTTFFGFGILNLFGHYAMHLGKIFEEICLAQVGIAIVTCSFFKLIHVTFVLHSKQKVIVVLSVFLTITAHLCSIFSIGKKTKRKFVGGRDIK